MLRSSHCRSSTKPATTQPNRTPSRSSSQSSSSCSSSSPESRLDTLPRELQQRILTLVLSPHDDSPTRVSNALSIAAGSGVLAEQLEPVLKRHKKWLEAEIRQRREEMARVPLADWSWFGEVGVHGPDDGEGARQRGREEWEAEWQRKMMLECRIDGLIVEMGRLDSLI